MTEVGARGAGIGKRREADEVAKRTKTGRQRTSTIRGMALVLKKRSSGQSRYAGVPVPVLGVSECELRAEDPRCETDPFQDRDDIVHIGEAELLPVRMQENRLARVRSATRRSLVGGRGGAFVKLGDVVEEE